MKNKAGGFTLLEVMVAMAILAMALAGVYQLQSQSISMATESRFLTSAALLAQSKMTDIEAATTLNSPSENGDFGPDYPQYNWRLEITDIELSQLKKIVVTVSNKAFVNGGSYTLILYKAMAN
jgi:general secretion pathway protein I